MIFLVTLPKLSCKIKDTTGFECPGCGIQRSFELLINGEFLASIKMYPGLIPMILTLGILLFHSYKGTMKTLTILKISLIFTGLIITINYLFYILKL